ncbi:MAG: hypothetical protein LBP33_02800 [Candidatus Adiutrix sp.]|nr:hypothetical protein [Candidatus Adiutrix sp.]
MVWAAGPGRPGPGRKATRTATGTVAAGRGSAVIAAGTAGLGPGYGKVVWILI